MRQTKWLGKYSKQNPKPTELNHLILTTARVILGILDEPKCDKLSKKNLLLLPWQRTDINL
jgi:hypothetical protein